MKDRPIAFICPSLSWGGLEMNVFRLALWLKMRGRKIILYGHPDAVLYDNCRKESIEVRELRSRSKFGDLFLAYRLARQLKKDKARIAVLHMNKNFLLMTLAKALSGNYFNLIYMQHMHVGASKRDPYHHWVYSQLDAWVTPLDLFKDDVAHKTRINRERIEVIPFGIELEQFTDHKPSKTVARKRLQIPSDVLVAGVVGRLDPKKGQHVLIEACHKLHQQGHQLHLLLVGDKSKNEETGYAERLHEMVAEYGLSDFVHFRSYMADIEYAFAAMDIFALTSKSETYGMVTIEAMASGLAVIGTAEGGTVDIIDDGVNGLLVEPLDVEQLRQALLKLITDREFAARISSRAREDALAKYSHRHQCDLLESLFDRLVTGSA